MVRSQRLVETLQITVRTASTGGWEERGAGPEHPGRSSSCKPTSCNEFEKYIPHSLEANVQPKLTPRNTSTSGRVIWASLHNSFSDKYFFTMKLYSNNKITMANIYLMFTV